MTYAPNQTRFDFPRIVRGVVFVEAIADEFSAEDIPEPYKPTDNLKPEPAPNYDEMKYEVEEEVVKDFIDDWDDDQCSRDDADFRRTFEYCEDCGGPCMYDGYSSYDPYDMSYLEDEDTKCDIAGCYSEPDAPSIHCDEHGNVYNRYHEEIEERVDKLIEEHGENGCVYRCAIMQTVHCGFHGHLYDPSFHVDEGDDRFDGDYEDNPEAAEYDIVETYTDWERTFHRFYDDRRQQYDQKEAARNRYLTSTSKRNRRREGSVKMRGFHKKRSDLNWDNRDKYLDEKYDFVD